MATLTYSPIPFNVSICVLDLLYPFSHGRVCSVFHNINVAHGVIYYKQ